MSKISTYEVVPVPKLADKLIGTSVGGEIEDVTYNFTLLELLNLFLPNIPSNNLQGVLDYGNTATQDINLFGTITTTNLDVTDTANIYDSYLTGETHVQGGLFDSTESIGTAGQVLTSTGEFVEWVTLPPIFTPNLQQVLEVGNTSTTGIILDAGLEALDVNTDTATINTNITIDGTITDGLSGVGTSGQVLSSTVTGVEWVSLPVYSATSPLLFNSATGVFSIQQATSYQSGYLSASDWVTFDGKQNAGNYITALTGEATASGPGIATITLTNSAVIGKILTGFNPTAGTINASDSILTAFGKTQSQINALVGGVQYKGTWDASTNTPTLTSSVGVQGNYYIVSVAGNTNLNGITDWQVGDWAIFSETTWQKVDNTDAVSSVNGFTGAVSLTTDNIPEGTTNLYYLNSRARAALSATSPLLYNNLTGVFNIQQSTASQDGYLSSTDWNTFNNKQNYLGGTGLVKSSSGAITYITDNSSNWNTAYDNMIVSAEVTGTSIKTLTLTQQDAGTITANWSDSGLTSVGLSMPSAFSVSNNPLTSNGTLAVSAIGTPNQYIRGDGALATFPTTGGGGSAVYYYLNGSIPATVVGYEQMANTAVIGAGTDFNLVGNGLIAQFLTDVGNPNRLLIPGGAWNFEMFFSVSSTGGNQKFYVELFKYDGVVFTSIANNSINPEEITGGTSTDLYLTSLAVPETTLLVTDRLALRVYIVDNSVGRTVTLHTEDNNLCQITTTFSAGIAALNGLTANTQYFAVGTFGTDFNIVSNLDTHTFNIPSASATNRGLITIGTQSIGGIKTFLNSTIHEGLSVLKNDAFQIIPTGYVGLTGYGLGGLTIIQGDGTTIYNSDLKFPSTSNRQYTFPDITGTIALLQGTQTFSGSKSFTAFTSFTGLTTRLVNGLYFDKGGSPSALTTTTTNLYSDSGNNNIVSQDNNNKSKLQFQGSSDYTYTFPAATGTIALTSNLSAYLPLTGGTITGQLNIDNGISLKDNTGFGSITGYTNIISGSSPGSVFSISAVNSSGIVRTLAFTASGSNYTYNFPSGSGTVVLTSDLGTYVPYTGATTNVNLGAFNLFVWGLTLGRGGSGISTNTTMGINALSINTTGYSNSAFGYLALSSNTSGYSNTAFGSNTLQNNTASNNTAIGYDALYANTSGSENTAIGNTSLEDNTTGAQNTSNGASSSRSNTTGNNNSSFGYGSLNRNTTGNQNTALGSGALFFNNGTGNIAIGYNSANAIMTGSYNTIIGNYSGTSAMSSNVILSDGQGNIRYQFDGTKNNFYNDVNLGVNEISAGYITSLGDIYATYGIRAGYGIVIQKNGIVASAGAGQMQIYAPTGTASVLTIKDGNSTFNAQLTFDNTASRTYTLPSASGTIALTSNLSSYLPLAGGTLTGALTGTSATFSGRLNSSTLYVNSTEYSFGNFVSAVIGPRPNADGIANLWLRPSDTSNNVGTALASTSSAFTIGSLVAGPFLSIALSTGAATFSSSVTSTIANGYFLSAVSATTSEIYARIGNTSAFLSIGCEGSTGGTIASGTSAYAAVISQYQNNPLQLATNNLVRLTISGAGNVGIGTTDLPYAKVSIKSNTTTSYGGLNVFANGNNNFIALNHTGSLGIIETESWTGGGFTPIAFVTSGGERMRITTGGNVAIGTTTDGGFRAHIKGAGGVLISAGSSSSNNSFYVQNEGESTTFFRVRGDGAIYTGTTTVSPYNNSLTGTSRTVWVDNGGVLGYVVSIRESKANIKQLSNIDWLYKLNPVSFNYRKKDDKRNYTEESENEKWYGLIADEVESVNSDLVFYNINEDGTKSLAGVEYYKLISALVKSVQQLKQEIELIKNK